MSKTFKPPVKVANAAYEGLVLRNEYKRGGTSVGLARAKQLAYRHPVTLETIVRMYKFFNRHYKNRNTPPAKGNGKIAWLLWGGNPGFSWVKKVLKEEGYR